ncbi:MAG: hypothetical protein V3V84_07850 [Candidatus Bathyarchaeia archaeon]
MHNNLWLKWIVSLSAFVLLHLIYINYDQVLLDEDRNIAWYGFLTVLDILTASILIVCNFKPFSSYIAWAALASSLVNMAYGIFYVYSGITPVWLDATMISLYIHITSAITVIQLLLFLVAGQQIDRYLRDNNNSIFSLFVGKNNKGNEEDLA